MKEIKKILKKNIVFGLGSVLGIAQRKLYGKNLTVFCYHDVTNAPSDFSSENGLNVTPEVFNYQIAYIKKNFNVIGPKQLMEKTLPTNAALVTFDDGFKSFFTNALPILENNKIPLIIFLNMGPIRGEMFWPGLIVFLCEKRPDFITYLNSQIELGEEKVPLYLSCSKDVVEDFIKKNSEDFQKIVLDYVGLFADENDLEKYSHNSYVFYGNHTYTHFVSCLMNDKNFFADVEKNSKFLRMYPNYIDYFAFPFGQPGSTFTDSQVKLLLEKEFKMVFFSSGTINESSPLPQFLDRVTLFSEDISHSKIMYRVMKPWLFNQVKFLNELVFRDKLKLRT